MFAIIGLFIIIIVSLTVVRIGSIALELTGLSREVAGFQAQSAFSGAGFTTSEAESVVHHPARRKIIRTLIFIGSIGIISTGATLIIALIGTNNSNFSSRSAYLLIGILICYLLASSQFVYSLMKKIIVGVLKKTKSLQLHDYYDILGVSQGYSVSRMQIKKDTWLLDKKLKDLNLQKEGTTILGIKRLKNGKENFLVPNGDLEILANDYLTIYGRKDALNCLFMRPKGEEGDKAHNKRMKENEILN